MFFRAKKCGRFILKTEATRRKKALAQILRLRNKVSSESDNIVTGRRIIDVDLLAKKMRCSKYNCLVHFSHIGKEVIHGLGSRFYMRCPSFSDIIIVPSSKSIITPEGKSVLAVNCKAAATKKTCNLSPWKYFNIIHI